MIRIDVGAVSVINGLISFKRCSHIQTLNELVKNNNKAILFYKEKLSMMEEITFFLPLSI